MHGSSESSQHEADSCSCVVLSSVVDSVIEGSDIFEISGCDYTSSWTSLAMYDVNRSGRSESSIFNKKSCLSHSEPDIYPQNAHQSYYVDLADESEIEPSLFILAGAHQNPSTKGDLPKGVGTTVASDIIFPSQARSAEKQSI